MERRDPICIFDPKKKAAASLPDLRAILTDDLLDLKVAVISIAGRFRQGKSFLMNFAVQYLKAQGAPGWMADGVIGGFNREPSRKPVTAGVLVWPEVFKMQDASGEEIAVVLMDTQGVLDTTTSVKDCRSIFALSVLLSSTQIFNVKQHIQEDDLSQLELFTKFGRLVCSKASDGSSQNTVKPFQDLTFLVRDWAYPDENSYGWEGGQQVLDRELKMLHGGTELATMRGSIKNCFESTKCFLMPHPGKKVDASSKFKEALADIGPRMREYLECFIEDMFKPGNLKTKRVHGRELTLRDFPVFVERYVRAMNSYKLLNPPSLYDATVSATNSALIGTCLEMYEAQLSALITEKPQEPARFEEVHDSVLEDVISHFNKSLKMGGEAIIAGALRDLNARIAMMKPHFCRLNSAAYDKMQCDQKIAKLTDAQKKLSARISESERRERNLAEGLQKKQEEMTPLHTDAVEERFANKLAQSQLSMQIEKAAEDRRRSEAEQSRLREEKRAMAEGAEKILKELSDTLDAAYKKSGLCSPS